MARVPLKILDARTLYGDSWSMALNRHPYCTGFGLKRQDDMVWRGTAEGSAGARCSYSSPSSLSFSTSSSSLSSSDDSLS
ncbi:hypothetical protein Tco_1193944 [Tanacetum coccineum]